MSMCALCPHAFCGLFSESYDDAIMLSSVMAMMSAVAITRSSVSVFIMAITFSIMPTAFYNGSVRNDYTDIQVYSRIFWLFMGPVL